MFKELKEFFFGKKIIETYEEYQYNREIVRRPSHKPQKSRVSSPRVQPAPNDSTDSLIVSTIILDSLTDNSSIYSGSHNSYTSHDSSSSSSCD